MPAQASNRRYLLISPCRDEAAYLGRTVESIARQSLKPALWIVVDDGSTDDTPRLLARYAAELPFLRTVDRDDRGFRQVGSGVVDAFNFGLTKIDLADFDYVCKLDMDLDLPERYFETLIEAMQQDPSLGTFSGKPYQIEPGSGSLISEYMGDDHSAGMAKFYRVPCFRDIGGFVRGLNWDGIDSHTCRMLGWRAESSDDPRLRFIHLRPMGSSQVGVLHGRIRFGRGQWFTGTSLPYMLAVALNRITWPPVAVGSLAMVWGYCTGFFKGEPRYENLEFRRHLRRYQWDALVLGKRRAMARALARSDRLALAGK